jgi:hypothetical protein
LNCRFCSEPANYVELLFGEVSQAERANMKTKLMLGGFSLFIFFLVGANTPAQNKAEKEKEDQAKKELEKKLAQKITVEMDAGPLADAIGYLRNCKTFTYRSSRFQLG